MNKPLTFLLFVFCISYGCKKYPSGGKLGGFTGTDDRIVGNYEIVSFTVNGNDSLSSLTSNYCTGLKIEFVKNAGEANQIKTSCGTLPSNYWRVTDDRLQIEITTKETTGANSLSALVKNTSHTLKWDIQRLKKDDLWISVRHNNDEYYLKLKK
ncbi:MAG TPA: hypothetical protein VD905_12605 [Flavobacteriales bacterium]|nr:hypothetical protein [Flavobacteriales bacterium]